MENRRLVNDVLVGLEQVFDRAHGVTQVVSTDAVLDADLVLLHPLIILVGRSSPKERPGVLARQAMTEALSLIHI